jgi:hypothetical protein
VSASNWPYVSWATPFIVSADTPRQPVTLIGGGSSYDPVTNPPLWHLDGLAQVFAKGVPIPPHFSLSTDGDHTAAILCPETGEYWEFYYAGKVPAGQPNAGSWYSVGGGAIKDTRRFHGGGFDETAYPGYSTDQWGTRASGIPLMAGVVTIDEIWSGRIPHIVAMSIPYPRLGWVAQPARRTDATASNTDQYAVGHGYHYRLNLTASQIAATGYSPITKLFLTAMAEFGVISVDRSGGRYGLYLEDGTDHAARHGGHSAFSEEIEGNPPIYRTSDTKNANGTWPGATSGSWTHFPNMWVSSSSQVQCSRRVLTWPARPSDGAY